MDTMTPTITLTLPASWNCERVDAAIDEHTLEQFLKSVERRALRMAELATANREEALDLVQDAMFGFVRHYAAKPVVDWTPLFYRVLDSRLNDWHRRRQRQAFLLRVREGLDVAATANSMRCNEAEQQFRCRRDRIPRCVWGRGGWLGSGGAGRSRRATRQNPPTASDKDHATTDSHADRGSGHGSGWPHGMGAGRGTSAASGRAALVVDLDPGTARQGAGSLSQMERVESRPTCKVA